MKNQPSAVTAPAQPSQDDIRSYAFHLYQQSNCSEGHDLDNWLEATACLKANVLPHEAGTRLHRYFKDLESGASRVLFAGAKALS